MSFFPDTFHSASLVAFHPRSYPLLKSEDQVQEMRSLFVARSLQAQFADYQYFHRYGRMGDVIVLVGTSSAGKSSIIKALRQIEPDRIEDGIDLRADARFLEYYKLKCPNEVTMLEKVMDPLDIPKAVASPERTWKRALSEQEMADAERLIQHIQEVEKSAPEAEMQEWFQNMEPQMFDDAFEHSRLGRSIIFDVANVDAIARHTLMRNFPGPMCVALVYCPFSALSSRMEVRNREAEESGHLMNRRVGELAFIQFSEIYTRKAQDQPPLELITRSQAIKTFDDNFDKGDRLGNKDTSRQTFLDNLGFTPNDNKVNIAPRNQHLYHLFLHSGKLTAQESAQILHNGCRSPV